MACDGFAHGSSPGKILTIEVDAAVNPNAQFWAPATGSPPAANQFGVVIRHPGACPANLNNVNSVDYYIEFVVQWRTAS